MLRISQNKSQIYFYSELFVRLICVLFFFAFTDSLYQFKETIGEQGCAPVSEFTQHAYASLGPLAYFRFPGVFWFSGSNTTIVVVFVLGALSSVIGFFGRFTTLSLLLAFICWISVINAGSDFFIYIWDTLLAEAGFIALMVSLLNQNEKYDRIIAFSLWFFAFRLWFSMGIVTLLHNNSVAVNGPFITCFLQNQPFPTLVSYYLYQLPGWFHEFISTAFLIIEAVFPFLIFFRKTRFVSFCVFCVFSILIFLCGNYAWFNILTVVICLPMLIETRYGKIIFAHFKNSALKKYSLNVPGSFQIARALLYVQLLLQCLLTVFILFPTGNRYLNFLNYYNYTKEFVTWENSNLVTKLISMPLNAGSGFKIANPYGVFKGIPVKRWEIEFELYSDTTSRPLKKISYAYKPGLSSGSSYFAPHHPRIEQQLFYEAQQGSFYRNYTPYQNRFDSTCWTKRYIIKLLRDNNCNYVKIILVQLDYAPWDNYKNGAGIWKKKKIHSFYLNQNSLPCPLIPDEYFKRFNKHAN